MEYSQHPTIKKIIADSNKAFVSCACDILSVNPNHVPRYARVISRYQDLIKRYDKLNEVQQSRVQSNINAVTKQLTTLLKITNNSTESPAKAVYLLGVIAQLERQMLNQLSSTPASAAALAC